MPALKRVAPFLVVLFGFAVRVYAMDTTWVDGDRANPHGIGLLLVHQLSRGEFTELLLFSDDASIGLPNTPLVNYVWAILSLFERSLFSATAFGLLVNVLAIAVVYVLGRRCFGWATGMFAATLIASSNWGVYLARGAWHPGQLEIGVVTTACLLSISLQYRRRIQLFWGLTAALLTASAYFTALFIPFQAAVATLFAGAWILPLRRVWVAGMAMCIAGVGAFALSMVLSGRLSPERWRNISLFDREAGALSEADLIARDITPFNRDPIGHFFRLASNRDYALTWTGAAYQAYPVREPLSQALAVVVSVFVGIGLVRMLINIRQPVNRFLLLWAALPIAALFIIAAFKYDFRISIYYLVLTAPVMYIAGGYGFASVASLLKFRAPAILATCAALAFVPAWNFSAAAETVYNQTFIQPDFMPLKWSRQLGRMWQRECALINGSNYWWELSLIESPSRWRQGGTRFNDSSSIWTVAPEGGTCALKPTGAPLPNSELLPLQLDDGLVVRTYRSLPYAVPRDISTTVNLGWSLLDYTVPDEAAAGSTIHVQHAWRVDSLPNEPHANWYFAPFVKLIAPDGKAVVEVDNAVALPGREWRVDEVQVSDVQVTLPGDLAPGTYTLQSSLFDPNQKKNAVYFNIGDLSKPVLTLERAIWIESRASVTSLRRVTRVARTAFFARE